MDSIGVPSSQFADSCEIPRPSFSQLLSGRNQKVSDVLIKKIHSAYPELSILWLMFGEGNMVSGSEESKEASSSKELIKNSKPNSQIASELPENPTGGQDNALYSNLRGLNTIDQQAKSTIYQQLEENKKIIELQMQIEKLTKNPRRVTQITVYYDDSTFETFIPSK